MELSSNVILFIYFISADARRRRSSSQSPELISHVTLFDSFISSRTRHMDIRLHVVRDAHLYVAGRALARARRVRSTEFPYRVEWDCCLQNEDEGEAEWDGDGEDKGEKGKKGV
jgi:hypothetical protein